MSDKKNNSGSGVITDNRFKKAQFDPKFKLRRRKLDNAIQSDDRFSKALASKRFNEKTQVDLYGRRFEESDDEEKDEVAEKPVKSKVVAQKKVDSTTTKKTAAVAVVAAPSTKANNKKQAATQQTKAATPSDNRFNIPQKWKDSNLVEEDEEEEEEEEEEEVPVSKKQQQQQQQQNNKKNNTPVVVDTKKKQSKQQVVQEEEEQVNSEDDEDKRELLYGGFDYNSDTESSDEEGVIEDEIEEEEEEEDVPRGDASKRFAVLNCDWGNFTSRDLFIVFNSFTPKNGRIESITVYPSDYGLKQIELEKQSGPNRAIWNDNKKKQQTDLEEQSRASIAAKASLEYDRRNDAESLDGDGFDLEKLRKYEMDKLKYFYAVVQCDSVETANAIYDECDGLDIGETANTLDLRFVPDDQVFTNEPRDTCTDMPQSGPNLEFQTNVLKGTSVDFTWDVDKTRRRKLTGTFNDFEEDDIKTYLAEPEASSDEGEEKMSRLKLRNKYRSLLFGNDNDDNLVQEKDDLKVTFKSALDDGNENQDEDEEEEDGFTIKFSDQEGGQSSSEEEESDDESEEQEEDSDDESGEENSEVETDSDYDDSWQKELQSMDSDDDATMKEITINTDLNLVGKKLLKDKEKRENSNVWNDYLEKRKSKKYEKKHEKKVREQEEERRAQEEEKRKKKGPNEQEKKQIAELELLMLESNQDKNKGFSKKDLQREHKENTTGKKKNKKNKGGKKNEDDDDTESFKIDVKDARFHSLFVKPEFAIDPTNPKYSKTNALKEILEEKKRRREETKNDFNSDLKKMKPTTETNNNNNNGTASDLDRFKAMTKNIQKNTQKMNDKKATLKKN
ncbi:hypothetical protein DFA_09040 [Cavenderia fasciculata]|uniref:NUC153 domain-containing protein n=1 Tax=Cavenderia fasciculata TaxID=261658 RepID=F4Q6J2_CACFS|nr:uncharacterized protein DFA_09040 [Cavenderia fasciculata]EGG16502.1 hypothetical protein DFA_09040 [Cavenderia fasciculata]|eukprot:XP_004354902.1 hypothetical protein DFA_09040 [Cavenderia fasciculata]